MKRPTFLTVWLVLMFIGGLFSLYSYFVTPATLKVAYPNIPEWYAPLFGVLSLVQYVGLYLLWTWKKLGFQIAVGMYIVAIVLNFAILGAATAIFTLVGGGIGLGILYLAMKPVWKNFK